MARYLKTIPFQDRLFIHMAIAIRKVLRGNSAGNLWETEHGPITLDEINLIKPGRNYGWPVMRGDEKRHCSLMTGVLQHDLRGGVLASTYRDWLSSHTARTRNQLRQQ